MNSETYRRHALEAIRKGHTVTRKKAVPKKKSPTGRAVPAVKERVPGVASKILFGKTIMNKVAGSSVAAVEAELGEMRKEGIIHCTNGIWWER